ncbi:MAG TPA: TetR family transcriptional regulator [Solirubrobacteraceae bacterium]
MPHDVTARELVAASQRRRLIHGVMDAVAEKGLAATTVTDITDRAGVSKKTLYEHFPDKLACFLAAYQEKAAAMLQHVGAASIAAREDGADAADQLRAGTRAYLEFLVAEAPYARTFALEMSAAGPEAIAHHRACRDGFAATVRAWFALSHPDRPAPTDFAFEAATGVVYETTSARIATNRVDELLALEDELVAAQLAILGVA